MVRQDLDVFVGLVRHHDAALIAGRLATDERAALDRLPPAGSVMIGGAAMPPGAGQGPTANAHLASDFDLDALAELQRYRLGELDFDEQDARVDRA